MSVTKQNHFNFGSINTAFGDGEMKNFGESHPQMAALDLALEFPGPSLGPSLQTLAASPKAYLGVPV